MKGFDLLINNLAFTSCPSEYDLKNVNFDENPDKNYQCLHYNISDNSAIRCKDCYKKAVELEYDESETLYGQD